MNTAFYFAVFHFQLLTQIYGLIKRKEKGIQTASEQKKDTPKGLWYKSPTGKIVEAEELARNYYVSPEDDYHVRIGSKEYFEILF